KPDRGLSTTEQKQPAVEGELVCNVVSQRARRGFRLLVLHQFEADHQTSSAHVADVGIFVYPGLHALHHRCADGRSVLYAFAFEDVQGGSRSRDAYRITAVRAGVRSGDPIHDVSFRHANRERHAGGDALGHADDVRLNARVFDRPPFAGASNARLYLVDDHQDAVAIADVADFTQEAVRRDDVSAFALDRFYDDRGNFLGRKHRLE